MWTSNRTEINGKVCSSPPPWRRPLWPSMPCRRNRKSVTDKQGHYVMGAAEATRTVRASAVCTSVTGPVAGQVLRIDRHITDPVKKPRKPSFEVRISRGAVLAQLKGEMTGRPGPFLPPRILQREWLWVPPLSATWCPRPGCSPAPDADAPPHLLRSRRGS